MQLRSSPAAHLDNSFSLPNRYMGNGVPYHSIGSRVPAEFNIVGLDGFPILYFW